jgi:predicted AAA+ superfamily ATPase
LEFFGHLLEQYVGLELLKIMALKNNPCKHLQLKYWRDTSGVEVDWVLEINDSYIPIEVKWTDRPNINDAKYLKIFLQEYNVTIAYIVCRTPNRMKLADNIYAIPWQELSSIIDTQ